MGLTFFLEERSNWQVASDLRRLAIPVRFKNPWNV
jgi:hypothetical protein